MKSYREYLWFNTPHRRDYLNITDKVNEVLRKSKIKEGLCLVNAMHITAGVYINDAESGLIQDFDDFLEKCGGVKRRNQLKREMLRLV